MVSHERRSGTRIRCNAREGAAGSFYRHSVCLRHSRGTPPNKYGGCTCYASQQQDKRTWLRHRRGNRRDNDGRCYWRPAVCHQDGWGGACGRCWLHGCGCRDEGHRLAYVGYRRDIGKWHRRQHHGFKPGRHKRNRHGVIRQVFTAQYAKPLQHLLRAQLRRTQPVWRRDGVHWPQMGHAKVSRRMHNVLLGQRGTLGQALLIVFDPAGAVRAGRKRFDTADAYRNQQTGTGHDSKSHVTPRKYAQVAHLVDVSLREGCAFHKDFAILPPYQGGTISRLETHYRDSIGTLTQSSSGSARVASCLIYGQSPYLDSYRWLKGRNAG